MALLDFVHIFEDGLEQIELSVNLISKVHIPFVPVLYGVSVWAFIRDYVAMFNHTLGKEICVDDV